MKERGVSFGLVVSLIVVFALVFRLWLALTLPTSSLPDEESHFNYVRFIAKNWRPPTLSEASSQESGYELRIQPPTYYYGAALVYNFTSCFGMGAEFYSLRVLSVFLSVAAIIVGYKAIQAITASRIVLLSSVLLMAFTPKVMLVSPGINNDQLSWLFSGVVLYYVVRSVDREPKPVRMGMWTGLAVVTKLTTIPFAVGALVACLLGGRHSGTMKQSGLRALKYLVVLSIMTSWLVLWNIYTLGTPIPVSGWRAVENKPYRFFVPDLASLGNLQATPSDVRYQWQGQLQPNILWGNLATLFSFWLDSRTISGWPPALADWLLFWGMIVFLPTLIISLGVYASVRKTGAASCDERRVSLLFVLVLSLFLGELNLFSYVVWETANGRLLYSTLPIIALFFGTGVSFLYLQLAGSHSIPK